VKSPPRPAHWFDELRSPAARCARLRPLALLCAVAAWLSACAPPAWDLKSLEAREPRLRALGSHRLGDATPYLFPARDELVLFLCRWESPDPIPVSLPPDATPEQAAALEAALRAWESAGLGVRFARGGPAGTGIELRLVEAASGAGELRGATTVADCALGAQGDASGGRLAARLVFASIHLRAGSVDGVGRPVPLEADQLTGAALHELGHALGFQGHAKAGDGAMRYQVDAIRRAGRRVLSGEPWRDDTLRALYSVPSGVVVGRTRLAPGRTQPVDRLLAMARAEELSGPVARVGDQEGQILFRDREGAAYTVWLRGIGSVLAGRPQELVLLPGPRARQRLSPRVLPAGKLARARPPRLRSGRARGGPRRVGTG
jgi:hypothetical protein